MQLTVLGATGPTGQQVVAQALAAGHRVTAPYTAPLPKLVIRLLMRRMFADKGAADDLYRASGLDWTLVYPAILTNGAHTGAYTAVETPDRKVADRISRADVADFMLHAA